MGWLYRTALRLVTRKRLKSERTRLLLEKSWLLEDGKYILSVFGDSDQRFLRNCCEMDRLNVKADAVNAEFARRGLV
jgi:hypothetical protein